jgi:hypothetical protein
MKRLTNVRPLCSASGGRLGLAALVGALLVLPATAHATSITGVLDFTFSGSSPSGDPTVNANDNGVPGEVILTFNLNDLSPTEKVSEFFLNLDPALDPDDLVIEQDSGPIATVSTETDFFKADGDGYFDLKFSWPTGGGDALTFDADETAVFTVTLANLVATDFAFISLCDPPGDGCGEGGYYAAAHVQSIGPTGALSGWVGADENLTPTPTIITPEPTSALLLLTTGGLGLIGRTVRRRKKS